MLGYTTCFYKILRSLRVKFRIALFLSQKLQVVRMTEINCDALKVKIFLTKEITQHSFSYAFGIKRFQLFGAVFDVSFFWVHVLCYFHFYLSISIHLDKNNIVCFLSILLLNTSFSSFFLTYSSSGLLQRCFLPCKVGSIWCHIIFSYKMHWNRFSNP